MSGELHAEEQNEEEDGGEGSQSGSSEESEGGLVGLIANLSGVSVTWNDNLPYRIPK